MKTVFAIAIGILCGMIIVGAIDLVLETLGWM
jgi:hypothetical protein